MSGETLRWEGRRRRRACVGEGGSEQGCVGRTRGGQAAKQSKSGPQQQRRHQWRRGGQWRRGAKGQPAQSQDRRATGHCSTAALQHCRQDAGMNVPRCDAPSAEVETQRSQVSSHTRATAAHVPGLPRSVICMVQTKKGPSYPHTQAPAIQNPHFRFSSSLPLSQLPLPRGSAVTSTSSASLLRSCTHVAHLHDADR